MVRVHVLLGASVLPPPRVLELLLARPLRGALEDLVLLLLVPRLFEVGFAVPPAAQPVLGVALALDRARGHVVVRGAAGLGGIDGGLVRGLLGRGRGLRHLRVVAVPVRLRGRRLGAVLRLVVLGQQGGLFCCFRGGFAGWAVVFVVGVSLV